MESARAFQVPSNVLLAAKTTAGASSRAVSGILMLPPHVGVVGRRVGATLRERRSVCLPPRLTNSTAGGSARLSHGSVRARFQHLRQVVCRVGNPREMRISGAVEVGDAERAVEFRALHQ